jgi:hypothetical protein
MVLFGVLFSWLVVERTDRKMRDDLLYQTRLGAQTIDLDQVRALSGADEDLEKEEYHSLRRRLSAFREAADCRYVYLMQRRPVGDNPAATEVVFLVEAQNDGVETSSPRSSTEALLSSKVRWRTNGASGSRLWFL